MAESKDRSGAIKCAVKLHVLGLDDTCNPELVALYAELPLSETIGELCRKWSLDPPNPEYYQLKFDPNVTKPPLIYINEQNRDKITQGNFLLLDYAPKEMCEALVHSFQHDEIDEQKLNRLSSLSCDRIFAEQFVKVDGFNELERFIGGVPTSGKIPMKYQYALSSFLDLMEHGIKTWNQLDNAFCASVFKYLDERSGAEQNAKIIKCALVIAESIVVCHTSDSSLLKEVDVGVSRFLHNIKKKDDPDLQCKCISLLNTILSVSTKSKQADICHYLLSKEIRKFIKDKIFTMPIQQDMAYQLYALQSRILNLYHHKLMSTINVKDEAALRDLHDIWKMVFENDADISGVPIRRASEKKDFSKLGFTNSDEPLEDFAVAPPGALALDCISFFARNYSPQYIHLVLENSRERADDQDCPFARASKELTTLLADILSIGKEPDEELPPDSSYYPMLFSEASPFEEFFCICIQKFSKTWKDMKASSADFKKVLMVVREQICRSLASKPVPFTFESFKTKLNFWSFAKIQEERQREQEAEEEKKIQAKPIKELRKMLEPEMLDVVKQQRINRMIEGFHFKSPRRGGRNKESFFCRLSHNTKVLQYGTCADTNSDPETWHSVNIFDILDISEEKNRKSELEIKLTLQDKEPLILVAGDQSLHAIWLDGLNALTGKPMTSKQAETDLSDLLSLEVKLKLLDAEGLSFPENPPPIPPLPPNFNFATA